MAAADFRCSAKAEGGIVGVHPLDQRSDLSRADLLIYRESFAESRWPTIGFIQHPTNAAFRPVSLLCREHDEGLHGIINDLDVSRKMGRDYVPSSRGFSPASWPRQVTL